VDSSPNNRCERERQLDRLVNEYYQAVERGRALDQAELIEKYPELAPDLREFFSGISNLRRAVRGAKADPEPAETQAPSDGPAMAQRSAWPAH
jgi:hypothetical protein